MVYRIFNTPVKDEQQEETGEVALADRDDPVAELKQKFDEMDDAELKSAHRDYRDWDWTECRQMAEEEMQERGLFVPGDGL